MEKQGTWETIKVQGGQVAEELRKLLHEGNVRRVIVRQKGRTVAEFPLTVGLVGAVIAPVLAAIGALVTLLAECSIDVERAVDPEPQRKPKARTSRARR